MFSMTNGKLTLLQDLWKLLMTIGVGLGTNTRMLLLAQKKVHVLKAYWTLAYQLDCLRRTMFLKLRHMFLHMGDSYT